MRGHDLHQYVYCAAVRRDIYPAFLLGLVEGESRRNSAAERWYTYNVPHVQSLIAANDLPALQIIVDDITINHGSDDISFGCTQQTWRWSVEYSQMYGRSTAGRNDLNAILAFRLRYLDFLYALRMAAFKLQGLLDRPDVAQDGLMALFKYNRSAIGVMPPLENQVNYRTSLERSMAWYQEDLERLEV